MGFPVHVIEFAENFGPVKQDRLSFGSILNVPFPAAAAAMGTVGAVTAGSGYTFTPTIVASGGTLTAASAAGVAPVVLAGAQAILRASMKVVSATVTAGGSGWATNDTVLLANGVELTVTASAGAASTLAVTTAGAITNPGPLPSTGQVALSTSGSGVGMVVTLSWGIGAALIDDSGSYSSFSGTTFTVASVDGNGASGAVAGPGVAAAAGAGVYKFLAMGPNNGLFGAVATPNVLLANPAVVVTVQAKIAGGVSFRVEPTRVANSVTAGSFDAIVWA